MSINTTYLMGRAGRDPEVRTAGQNKVATFTLCTGGKYKTKDGREVDDTAWHSIVAWRNLADLAEKYIRKGSQVLVVGRISYRKYTDANGVEKNVTEIVADKIELCGTKDAAPAQSQAPAPQQHYQTSPIVDDLPEDDSGLPFN